MATFKIPGPPERTGNNEDDLSQIYDYMCTFHEHMKYMFSNIDEENFNNDSEE